MANHESAYDLTKKFELFRSMVDATNHKYKESQGIIERLKDEINLFRLVEKNVRNEFSQAQTRLIELHTSRDEFLVAKEKNCENGEAISAVEERITELQNLILGIQEKNKQVLEATSHEKELCEKNDLLRRASAQKEAEFDLLKMEIMTTMQEKSTIVSDYENKIFKMQEELKESKRENNEIKTHSDRILLMYRKQLNDYEQTIRQYESERHISLVLTPINPTNKTDDDFASSQRGVGTYHNGWPNDEYKEVDKSEPFSIVNENQVHGFGQKKVTWGDNTVSSYSDERAVIETMQQEEESVNNKSEFNGFSNATASGSCENVRAFVPKAKTPNQKKQTGFKFPRPSLKQKHPLDFLSESRENSELTKKRRLYSTNQNHYLD